VCNRFTKCCHFLNSSRNKEKVKIKDKVSIKHGKRVAVVSPVIAKNANVKAAIINPNNTNLLNIVALPNKYSFAAYNVAD
jgi:hypothetical protein